MYIDATYYNDTYKGADAGTELDKYIDRASDLIDQVTKYVLVNYGFSNLATFIQNQVKKATASQVEFYVLNGGDQEINASTSDLNSVSVGSFSYQTYDNKSGKQANRISPSALEYLKPTGLLHTGVGVEHNAYYTSNK